MPSDDRGQGRLSIFTFGVEGINLSESLIARRPGQMTNIANGQMSYTFGLGGIEKRGGIAPIHAAVLAGPIQALGSIPLSSLFDLGSSGIFVSENDGGSAPFWAKSSDAVTFAAASGLSATETLRLTTPHAIPGQQSVATGPSALYFFGVINFDLLVYNGSTVTTLVAAAAWPTGGGGSTFTTPCCVVYSGGFVYVGAVYSDGLSYIVQVDVGTGTPTILGGTNITGGVLASDAAPHCLLVSSADLLYIGVGRNATAGRMYAYDLATPGGFILEATLPANGSSTFVHPLMLAEYSGEIYVSTGVNTSGVGTAFAGVYARAGGVWTSLISAHVADDGQTQVVGLAVFNSVLFATFQAVNDALATVWSWNGTSYSLDEDLAASFGVTAGALGEGHTRGFGTVALCVTAQGDALFARNPAGTWTQPFALPGAFDTGILAGAL